MLKMGTCIGFLQDVGCGLIYADEVCMGSRVVFVHFRDIQPKRGWQSLKHGERVCFVEDEEQGQAFYRPCAAMGVDGGFIQLVEDDDEPLIFCDLLQLQPTIVNAGQTVVVTGDIPENWTCPDFLKQQGDILFYGCRWLGKANFFNMNIQGDLVFLGCSFLDAFTLKETTVDGSVHMEGCDFSGAGGASFRGLQAQALYLDFGVKGPQDMVWLNELCIQQDVVIGGVFTGDIQVMRLQDERVFTPTFLSNKEQDRACFRRLCIGKEFYKNQNINKSILHGLLDVQGLHMGELIQIECAEIAGINLLSLGGSVAVSCAYSHILGSVFVHGQHAQSLIRHLNFQESYIEGHLDIREVLIQGELNLDGATVNRVIRLHGVSFEIDGGLKLARLCVNRLVMDDFSALYGRYQTRAWWKNPTFKMLQRETVQQSLNQGKPIELIQEYVLLKHLLSQEGQLQLEDEAFYNMRKLDHWYQDVGMLIYNYVFGWGVRLQNILITVSLLILVFAALYHMYFPNFDRWASLQLSIQSMFMAFFGAITPQVTANSALSWLVLCESVLGVVFITVFVGAYVRRLLR